MNLNQKETELLKELKGAEQLIAGKYEKAAQYASDAQLKNLFQSIAENERKHFDALNTIGSGSIPMENGSSVQPSAEQTFTAVYTDETQQKKDDCFLCTDLLESEKHSSHLYDTCVFEFRNEKVRETLNAIQRQEQEHGKMLYDYMKTNGMYS